jgi:SNF2 family DNA or RNA helicase
MKLYPFQETGVSFLSSRKRALIADEPGLGKTCQLIGAVNVVASANQPARLKVLVLCPKSIVMNWEREISVWNSSEAEYTVINWDKLIGAKHIDALLRVRWDVIIGDESHLAIKTENTKRCKAFLRLVERNGDARIWLSTATPATNSAGDYYVTLKILLGGLNDGGKAVRSLGSLNGFREIFCHKVPNPFTPRGFDYKGFKNTPVLRKVFEKVAIKRRKRQVLADLPEKTHAKIWVKVDSTVLSDMLDIDEDVVEKVIDSGGVMPRPVATVLRAIGMAKLESALEWIECFPQDEPLVIFVWHRELGEILAKKLENAEVIHGDTSLEKRNEYVEKFWSGQIKRIVCNIVAGGVGLNLHVASNALFVELPWSPAHLIQAQDRVHRIGTSKGVFIYYMLAENTLDVRVHDVLMMKMKGMKEVGI